MGFVREAVVSGAFYPGDPKTLADEIQGYLLKARFQPVEGDVVGMISPHAGYIYSGQVAAYGMKAVSGASYDTVIIVGPSHRAYFEGAAMMDRGGYRTPLGMVDIDEDAARAIAGESALVSVNAGVHVPEHSLEVQIPFLQTVLKGFRIVPLIMGSQSGAVCEELAGAIYRGISGLGRRVLVVGSTDLSHYYPYGEAVKLDTHVVNRLGKFDIQGMMEDFNSEMCEACGRGLMLVTMMLSKAWGATDSRVLKYANSGDVSGDKTSVVGYASAVFYSAGDAEA